MPEFFIDYLGKISLEFKFPELSMNCLKDSNSILEAACESYSALQSSPSTETNQITHITYLLLLKEYSSCIQLYKELKISSAILNYNISLSSVYTGEYKFGLYLVQCIPTKDPSFLLLEVYLNYLLHNDTKTLELFSQYQNQYISQSKSQAIIPKPKKFFSQSNSRKTPIQLKKSSNHEHTKTLDFTTLSTSPSNIFYNKQRRKLIRPAPNCQKELIIMRKSSVKSSTKSFFRSKKTLGLNQHSIYTQPLFDYVDRKFTLKKFPDFPKLESPKDLGLKMLTKSELQKIKNHYLTPYKNLKQVHLILKKLKFFQQYTDEICLKLLNCAFYMFFSPGQVIFKEKEYADKFYVILQGSVSVLQEYKGLDIYLNSRYDGDTIGEYALARGSIEKTEAKRSASCVAGESLHTLYINSQDYTEIMNSTADNESFVICFLRTVQLFEHIPKIDLAHMANCLHPKHYFFENQILAVGEVPKGLYIVASGRVKAIYRKKVVELPPKYFFGQNAIVGKAKASSCRVISNAVDTTIIIIEPYHIELIYKPMRQITLNLISKSLSQDL